MFEELETYLLTITSPELTEVYITCLETLASAGITSTVDDLSDVLATESVVGRDQMINEIEAYLRSVMDATCNQFGVFLQDEFNIKYAEAIVRGLNLLTNWDDRETIESICLAELPPEDKLSDLLELVTEYSWVEYASTVARVTPGIFDRLLEQVTTTEDDFDAINNSPVAHIIVRVRSLLQQVDNPWILDDVDQGAKLGGSLESLLTLFGIRYEHEVQLNGSLNRNVELLTAQYLMYVLASNVPDVELANSAAQGAETVFTNIPTLLAVLQVIPKFLEG